MVANANLYLVANLYLLTRSGSRAATTFKMEYFVIIANRWKPLTIITKRSSLDVPAALDLPLLTLLRFGFGCSVYSMIILLVSIEYYYYSYFHFTFLWLWLARARGSYAIANIYFFPQLCLLKPFLFCLLNSAVG